jgi:hypothetical protein
MESEIVTANRLIDGAVVYLTENDSWSETIADACLATSETKKIILLESAALALKNQKIVGPYAMTAEDSPLGPVPQSQRERIRAAGPTIQFGPQIHQLPHHFRGL